LATNEQAAQRARSSASKETVMSFSIKHSWALLGFIAAASSASVFAQTPAYTDVLRFKTDGQLDSTFSGNGRKLIASVPQHMHARDLAKDASGRLIMGMEIDWWNPHFVVGRLDANGSPDNAFSGDGFAEYGEGKVKSVAAQGNKVIAIGSWENENQLGVVRFNEVGVVDAAVSIAVPGWSIRGSSVATIPNGRVYIVGTVWNQTESRFFVASRLSDLSADPWFDDDGIKLIAFPGWTHSTANAIAIDDTEGSGRLALAGRVSNAGGPPQIAIAYLQAYDGALMLAFDGDGRKTFAIGGGAQSQLANAVAIDRSRRIVVGGTATYSATEQRYVIARLLPTGAFDDSFSTYGVIRFGFAGSSSVDLRDLKITSDQGVVAVGAAYGTGSDYYNAVSIALLKSNGTVNTDFSSDGRVIFNASNSESNTANAVVIDSQGRFMAAGPIIDPTSE
jgi:uncharacterized delta-60 repeat protein